MASKHGIKEITIEINEDVDGVFLHNMFFEDRGVYDMSDAKISWPRVRNFKIQ